VSGEALGTVKGAYSNIAAAGVSTATLPPASNVSSAITSAFQAVSQFAAFRALNSTYGRSAFTFQVGNELSTGVTQAYYGFNFQKNNRSVTEFWDANLTSGAISGPSNRSIMPVQTTIYNSHNWAGWETWIPGTPQLEGFVTDQNYPTISTSSTGAQNVPSGTTVDQVAAVWADLTDSSGNILQDGFLTDATNHANGLGLAWYWLTGPGITGGSTGCSLYSVSTFASNVDASTGDSVSEMVKWSGANGYWLMEDNDLTSGHYGLVNMSVVNCGLSSGFHPYWGQEIVEAYTSGVIQQIAQFSQVNFYDITICPGRTTASCSYADNATSGTVYQLTQACASLSLGLCWAHNLNTNQNWNNAYGGHFNEYEYPDVSWQNSQYDYNCIYNGQYSGTC
jgi:hypothetical protein